MKKLLCLSTLIVMIACNGQPALESGPETDTLFERPRLEAAQGELAEIAREYFAAIRDDDAARIEAFVLARFGREAMKRRSAEDWTRIHVDLAQQVGPISRSVVIESSSTRLEVLTLLASTTEPTDDDWLSWVFLAAQGESEHVRGLRVSNAAAPEKWAPHLREGGAAELAAALKERLGTPAVAVALLTGSGEGDAAVVGLRRLDRASPAEPTDALHLGSITKSVTALLLATLIEEGSLSWDDTVADVLADDFDLHPAYRDVTLAEVARHRAGLVGHSRDIARAIERYADLPGSPTEQRASYLRDVLSTEPAAERGTVHYSNAGFCLLAHVCERETGEAYESLLRARVLKPIGIESASFGWPATASRPDGIWGHARGENGELMVFEGDERLGAFLAPAGDLALPLEDAARLLLQHAVGPRGASPILGTDGFVELHAAPAGSSHAAGLAVGERHGRRFLGHEGSTGVYWAKFRAWPGLGAVTLVAVNGPVDADGRRLVDAAFDAMLRSGVATSSRN